MIFSVSDTVGIIGKISRNEFCQYFSILYNIDTSVLMENILLVKNAYKITTRFPVVYFPYPRW